MYTRSGGKGKGGRKRASERERAPKRKTESVKEQVSKRASEWGSKKTF